MDHRRRNAREHGSTLVELAIILPLLIVMLLATMDFGRVFFRAMTVTNAAAAGAQYGAQSVGKSSDTAGMQSTASAAAADVPGFSASAARTCQCWNGTIETAMATCSSTCTGSVRVYVTVTGTAAFTTVVGYPGIPSPVTITRVARMRAQ